MSLTPALSLETFLPEPAPVWSAPQRQSGAGTAVVDSRERGETRLRALMQAAQDGDGTAYAALLRESVPVIRAVIAAVGVPSGTVDDVVQDVLLTIHRARHTYDSRRSFTPWLRTIAQRRAVDSLRSGGRVRSREVHAPESYETFPDPADAPGRRAEQADEAVRLRAAVAGLPGGQRQAVELLGLQQLSLDEAAAATGRTKIALKVNLHRALKALRQRLSADG